MSAIDQNFWLELFLLKPNEDVLMSLMAKDDFDELLIMKDKLSILMSNAIANISNENLIRQRNSMSTLIILVNIIMNSARDLTLSTVLNKVFGSLFQKLLKTLYHNICDALFNTNAKDLIETGLTLLFDMLKRTKDKQDLQTMSKFFFNHLSKKSIFHILLRPLDEVQDQRIMILALKIVAIVCSCDPVPENIYLSFLADLNEEKRSLYLENIHFVGKMASESRHNLEKPSWLTSLFYRNFERVDIIEHNDAKALFLLSYYYFSLSFTDTDLDNNQFFNTLRYSLELSFYSLLERSHDAYNGLNLGAISNMLKSDQFVDYAYIYQLDLFENNMAIKSTHPAYRKQMLFIEWIALFLNESLRRFYKRCASPVLIASCLQCMALITVALPIPYELHWHYLFEACNEESLKLEAVDSNTITLILALSNVHESLCFKNHNKFIITKVIGDYFYEMIRYEEKVSDFLETIDTMLLLRSYPNLFKNTKKILYHFRDMINNYCKDQDNTLDEQSVKTILSSTYNLEISDANLIEVECGVSVEAIDKLTFDILKNVSK